MLSISHRELIHADGSTTIGVELPENIDCSSDILSISLVTDVSHHRGYLIAIQNAVFVRVIPAIRLNASENHRMTRSKVKKLREEIRMWRRSLVEERC